MEVGILYLEFDCGYTRRVDTSDEEQGLREIQRKGRAHRGSVNGFIKS
jgi:hypothetical protein